MEIITGVISPGSSRLLLENTGTNQKYVETLLNVVFPFMIYYLYLHAETRGTSSSKQSWYDDQVSIKLYKACTLYWFVREETPRKDR